MSVLISGVGIAGPTLAYWLSVYGIKATLIERAPHLRAGGYTLDFWGRGHDIAERMGILPDLKRDGYDIKELRLVNERGRRIGGFNVDVFRAATDGRYLSIPRGDLAKNIYKKVEGRCETIFGDSIASIEQTTDGDRVSQIRMDTWSNGRVGLIGDAAFCPSLLAGQGSALAMIAAYALAGELGSPL